MNFSSRSREISVWWMECGSPVRARLTKWRACLDAAELARADCFHFEEDRFAYVAAHWLLRHALASIGGLPPADWRFKIAPHGKPGIDGGLNGPHIGFNLSHTRGFVACAVGYESMIGLDVERLSRVPELDIADRFFSPAEAALLRATPEEKKNETFLRFWTLKEAFIKATGEGLNRALQSFSFSLDPISIAFAPANSEESSKWSFIEERPTSSHLLALAVRHDRPMPGEKLFYRMHRVDAAG